MLVTLRALRLRLCGGGGAPVNFGRRRRHAAGPKQSAAARAARPINFFKGPRQNLVLSSTFSYDLFLVIDRKLQQNKYTAKMTSAARRQIIGGGAPINKSRRR